MPFIKVYVHFVWSTKSGIPYLKTSGIRNQLWQHIRENGMQKNLFIDTVGGYHDHCHCLVSLGVDQSIKKVVQLIKGESSYWLNHQLVGNFMKYKFAWQDDYWATSVSDFMVERVRGYIKKQEAHHTSKTFQEEYDEYIRRFKFGRG